LTFDLWVYALAVIAGSKTRYPHRVGVFVSLESRFKELPAEPAKCRTCLWYEALDEKDKAFFDEKVEAGNMKRLWLACRGNGLDVQVRAFREHFLQNHHTRGSG
jgi:hypothetical protein